MTLTKGSVSNNTGNVGGGIYNEGTVTATDPTMDSNIAIGGGAIENYVSASLTVRKGTIDGNSAIYYNGGGIDNYGTASVQDATISTNSAFIDGGGIDNESTGTLTVNDCTLPGNTGRANYGTSIDNEAGGAITVTDSTLS